MKKYFFALLIVVAGVMPATAQSGNESFDEFRKSIKREYNSFRKGVLDGYADFLDGVWKEYNAFKANERYSTPKPTTPPVADDNTPIVAAPLPDYAGEESPIAEERVDDTPSMPTPPAPDATPQPVAPKQVEKRSYNYHSLAFEVAKVEWAALPQGVAPKDFAQLWKAYSALKVEKVVLPVLLGVASDCHLNDWLFCECLRSYVDSEMSGMTPGQRLSLTHYLLSHAGYDVRIGLTSENTPLLMLALKQNVYSRGFVTINNTKYYIFFDNLDRGSQKAPFKFSTCDIPTDVDCGRGLDLVIRESLQIPYKGHKYAFSYGGINIEGEVNANIIPMLHHYPQMDVGCYAQSVVSQSTEENVAKQIAAQLTSYSKLEAVNRLLQFVQSAFSYATDDEQHGFEKPYFFEEMLYYPDCDCEDRSIFYSYLLKRVLDVENHLIMYPGHESVAVYLGSRIEGAGYVYDNKNFYISDPTYIGAVTGMCMPDYMGQMPKIDYKR